MSSVDSESFARLLMSGDPEAFTVLYREFERPLLAFFLRRVRTSELAADLTAEVFAAALVSRAGYRSETPVASWLFGIAQHKLIDSLRRGRVEDLARRRLGMPIISLADDDLERVESAAGAHVDVDAVLSGLPEDQRVAVRARILDERSYPDIARALMCSEAVARKRVSRGLARLRDAMERRYSRINSHTLRPQPVNRPVQQYTNTVRAQVIAGILWITQPAGGPQRNYCATPATGAPDIQVPALLDSMLLTADQQYIYSATTGPGAVRLLRSPIPKGCR
jgi:RNA polymerase sigma factor (sigma-70 family)